MSWMQRVMSAVRRDRHAAQVSEEMELHLAMAVEDLMAEGLPEQQAWQEARRRFGNRLRLADETRDADTFAWLESWARDLGLAVRNLRRRPGLTVTALLSLGLGVGATTAIFSVVDAVILKPLALPEPDRVVVFRTIRDGYEIGGNPARMRDWNAGSEAIQWTTSLYGEDLRWRGPQGIEKLRSLRTYGHPLETMGVRPALGRGFTEDELLGRGAPVALLSYGCWQRRFGGDPAVLGQVIDLVEQQRTIIGVLPASFRYLTNDLVIPAPEGSQHPSREASFAFTAGRLAAGATVAQAAEQIEATQAALAEQYPQSDRGMQIIVTPLPDEEIRETRTPVFLLFGTVASVLLIACVNIAGLLLGRAAERQRESSIRAALGAGRGSLIRLYLAESLVLAGTAGLLGLLAAWWGVDLLKKLLPAELPRLEEAVMDWRVVLFSLAIALGAGLLSGIIPAWQASRLAGVDSARSTRGRRVSRWRHALVTTQVALSALLLTGAGLMAHSLYRLTAAPLGFAPERLLTLQIDFPWDTGADQIDQFSRSLLRELRTIPGVSAAGQADRLPLDGASQGRRVRIQGLPLPPALEQQEVSFRGASPDYLAAIGVPLRRGRWLADVPADGRREALINETFARTYFGDRNPIGQQIQFDPGAAEPVWFEVVGVTGDLRQRLNQSRQPAEAFVLSRHVYWPMLRFVVRADGDPANLAGAVREAVRRVSPDQVIDQISTMDAEVNRARSGPRIQAWLIGAFALVAIFLACIGLYGVLASDVNHRQREIGIRLALGATPAEVRTGTVLRGLVLTFAGLAAGLMGAYGLAGVLAELLYGVGPFDWVAFSAAAAILTIVAALACWLPADRAARIDPAATLRCD